MDERDYRWLSEWSFRLYIELVVIAIIYLLGLFVISRKYSGRRAVIRLAMLSGIVSVVWFSIAFVESLTSGGNPGWNVAALIREQPNFKMVVLPGELWRFGRELLGYSSEADYIAGPISVLLLAASFFLAGNLVVYLLKVAMPVER